MGDLDLFGADNGDQDPTVLPLTAAVRQRKTGLEVGDGSVLKRARMAASSVPASSADQPRQPSLPQAQRASQGAGPQSQADGVGAYGGRSPTLGGLAAGYDTQIANYQKQLVGLSEDPDYTALGEQQRARGQQGVQMLGASIAAGMGPRDLNPLQGQLAQESARMMAPQKIEGGEVDVSGNVRLDPGYKRQKQIESLRSAIDALEKHKLTATTAEEKYRVEAAQQQMMNEFRQLTLEGQAEGRADRRAMAQANLDLRRDLHADKSGGGKLQAHGVTPDGKIVSYSPTLGQTFIADPKGEGLIPYTGPMLSQQTADKQVMLANELQQHGAALNMIEDTVRKNPGAFGGVTSLAALTPEIIQTRIINAKLTPEQQVARGLVLHQAAETINQLYGAALSAGESTRATAFIPDAKDPPEMILNKLIAARRWQQTKLRAMGPFATQARTIMGGPDTGPQTVADRKQAAYDAVSGGP